MDLGTVGTVGAAQWTLIHRSVTLLAFFAAAGMVSAGAFAAGRAIVPSLHDTGELPPAAARYARYVPPAAYAAAAVAGLVAVWLLLQALGAAGDVLRDV